MLFCTEKYVTKIDNLKIKEKLYFVATGQTSKKGWLLPLINRISTADSTTALNQVREDFSPSCSEETYLSTSIPTDSNVQLPSLRDEEIKKTYTDLLSNMTQVFNKYFEKSPLEVIGSMEKMVSTLESIKTPAAFSSAVATFGHGKYFLVIFS